MSVADQTSAPPFTPSPTFAQIFGPVFWGFCAALILCGVSVMQGYLYFTRYNDKIGVRMVAWMMLILDFISMGLISQSVYYYMLPHFGSFAPLNAVTKELILECLISAVITLTSQLYFVYQLHMVNIPGTAAKIMNAFVLVLALCAFGGASGCVVVMFQHPHSIFMNRNHTFAILAGLSKAAAATADIIATLAMCLFLKSAHTGITKTSSLLNSLMQLFINRGILVTVAQILLLITFFSTAGHLYWLAVHINTTKLYVNTFFGMLNARTALADRYAAGRMSMTESGMSQSHRGVAAKMAAIGAREKVNMSTLDTTPEEYTLGEIRVTTTSTVANI